MCVNHIAVLFNRLARMRLLKRCNHLRSLRVLLCVIASLWTRCNRRLVCILLHLVCGYVWIVTHFYHYVELHNCESLEAKTCYFKTDFQKSTKNVEDQLNTGKSWKSWRPDLATSLGDES